MVTSGLHQHRAVFSYIDRGRGFPHDAKSYTQWRSMSLQSSVALFDPSVMSVDRVPRSSSIETSVLDNLRPDENPYMNIFGWEFPIGIRGA